MDLTHQSLLVRLVRNARTLEELKKAVIEIVWLLPNA